MTKQDNVLKKFRPRGFECMCGNVRMAARSLTNVYDEHLQPSGLRSTQLAVLWEADSDGQLHSDKDAKGARARQAYCASRRRRSPSKAGACNAQGPKSLLLSDAAVGKSAGGCDSQAEGQKSARCQLVIAKSFKRAAALIFFDQMLVYTDINHAAVGPYRDFDL